MESFECRLSKYLQNHGKANRKRNRNFAYGGGKLNTIVRNPSEILLTGAFVLQKKLLFLNGKLKRKLKSFDKHVDNFRHFHKST